MKSKMYKIILIAILIAVASHLNVNAGTKCQANSGIDTDKYSVEIIPVNDENLRLIKFTINSDCHVKIKVTEPGHKKVLNIVDDEMLSGEYRVYCKLQGKVIAEGYSCTMEISNDKNEILYSKEIGLLSKKSK